MGRCEVPGAGRDLSGIALGRHRIIPPVQPAASHRVVYEASIDDAVDVAIRLSRKSQALQKQIRAMIVGTGILGAAAFVGAWLFYSTSRTPVAIAIAAAGAILFGIVFAFMFRHFLAKETRKQQRKIVAEHFAGKPTVTCEAELRADGVWVRQMGIEITFPWTVCTGVHENADDVQIDFAAGMCVVRNRHFRSAEARQSFLDAARRLSARR